MATTWRGVMVAVLVLGGVAEAHDLTVDLTVRGNLSRSPLAADAVVDTYPTTLHLQTTVKNAYPHDVSSLLAASDPTLAGRGWSFSPAPPVDVPVGGQLDYTFDLTLTGPADCAALAAGDEDPSTPGPGPDASFTDTVHIAWDSGAAQASVRITCKAQEAKTPFPCDDTLYVLLRDDATGVTTVRTMDTVTGATTVVATMPAGKSLENIGFDHRAGLIYGLSSSEPFTETHLIRIDATGVVEDLGAIPINAAGSPIHAGVFLPDGVYFAAHIFGAVWARIDVSLRMILDQSGRPGFFDLGDFLASPTDGQLYGYDNLTHRFALVDPNTGAATLFGGPTPTNGSGVVPPNFRVDAMASDRAGHFYVYGSDMLLPTEALDTLYRVEPATGVFTRLAQGPVGPYSDFAMCAFDDPAAPRVHPTRDEGFFKTHEEALGACLARGAVDLGVLGSVGDLPRGLGVLWANPAVSVLHRERSADERVTAKLAKQLLVGTCNQRLYGAEDGARARLSRGATALRSSSTPAERRAALTELEAANASGRHLPLPAGAVVGSATPSHAARSASEPVAHSPPVEPSFPSIGSTRVTPQPGRAVPVGSVSAAQRGMSREERPRPSR